MAKKLYRIEQLSIIGGVCSGLGKYFNVDIVIVRLAFIFGFLFAGVGLIPYIILWIFVPIKRW